MVATRDFIENQISDCQRLIEKCQGEIEKCQRNIDIETAKIEAFRLALGQSLNGSRPDGRKAKSTRNRKPSGTWTKVLQWIAMRGTVTLDEMESYLTQIESPTPRKNIRSQMSIYRKKGIVSDADSSGSYSLSEESRIKYGTDSIDNKQSLPEQLENQQPYMNLIKSNENTFEDQIN